MEMRHVRRLGRLSGTRQEVSGVLGLQCAYRLIAVGWRYSGVRRSGAPKPSQR
jgi:hypothetical protein